METTRSIKNTGKETTEELEELVFNVKRTAHSLYWPANLYGYGKWLKEFAGYPSFLPLAIWTDHSGPSLWDDTGEYERKLRVPGIFKSSPRNISHFKKYSQVPAYCILSPFVYYRRSLNIQKSEDAKGTVVFPSHSSVQIEDQTDTEQYILDLLKLPEEYHPITVCMYYLDIQKQRHLSYLEHFRVVSAGHREDERFVERFYDILKQHQFASSNIPGSYLFYSVEMDIPFFLYGAPPRLVNKGNSSYKTSTVELTSPTFEKVNAFFSYPNRQIIKEQRDFVEYELGVNDSISQKKAHRVMLLALLHPYIWIYVLNRQIMKIRAFLKIGTRLKRLFT